MSDSEYQRVVLVTGSNAGIGHELVRLIAQEGHVVYIASRNEAAGKEAQGKLKSDYNLDVKCVHLEVTNAESVLAAKCLIEKAEGRLDVLVNNAGNGSFNSNQKASELDQSVLRDVFSVNFDGLVQVTTTFIPLLRKAKPGYGVILNVSSILGSNKILTIKQPVNALAAYNASKAAVNSYTISLSWELRKNDIKVNCGHPGWIATRINNFAKDGLTIEEGAKTLLKWVLLGPEDQGKTGMFFGPDGELPW